MKKNFKIIALLSILVILTPACHKEEDEIPDTSPKALFSMSSNKVCIGDSVEFINKSLNAKSCLWNFGDENTSMEIHPTHIYDKDGKYTVTLTAYSADGTKSDSTTKTIKVFNILPIASFSMSNDTVVIKDTVKFTNTSTNASNYLWDFGDGSTDSTEIHPTHIYDKEGPYTVTLTAYSADDTKSDDTTKIIEVKKETNPMASFNYLPQTVYVNDVVTFMNVSSDAGSYSWDFGDGKTSTEPSPTHSYSTAGNYTITLTAYSLDGTKSDEDTKNIEILALPEASFTMSSNEVYVNENVTFTNTSTNASGYSWDFGDGESSTETSPNHSYSTAGNYTITLTAYSYSPDGTKIDEATASIQVNNYPDPVANFTYFPETVYVKDTVTFTNESTDAASYSWDFGDGSATSTETSPIHSYSTDGVYTVTLTAYSPDGTKIDTHQEKITVVALPVAGFTYSPETVYVNNIVTFTNTSINAESYLWDFGDGSATSTETSPIHSYSTAGDYTVKLTAYSADGTKSDTHTENIIVKETIE